MSETLKKRIVTGLFWQTLEKSGSQGLSLLTSIILARLLMPEVFGCIAVLEIFIIFSGVFIDSGLSLALIQKQEIGEKDCCSVFYVNLFIAIILYILLFVSAPLVASFYKQPPLQNYLRVLALLLIIQSFALIQRALLQKRMLFHLNFRITWISLIVSGILGISLAYYGFGAWALIFQQLSGSITAAILLWIFVKWRPKFIFNWKSIQELFSFSKKILFSSLLECCTGNAYTLTIGKFFDMKTLAYFNRGIHIPRNGMGVINGALASVIFPALSQIQEDKIQLKDLMQKSIKSAMFFVLPIFTLLALVAEPFTLIVFGEKWLPSVIFLQLGCFYYILWPMHTLNLQLILAKGRSDYYFKITVIKNIQFFTILIISSHYGVVAMSWGLIFDGFLSYLENAWITGSLINYSIREQISDVLPLILPTGIATFISLLSMNFAEYPFFKLVIPCFLFIFLYIIISIYINSAPQNIKTYIKQKCSFIH